MAISQINKAFFAACHWHLCSSLFIRHANMIGRNNYNQSQLEKEKSALLQLQYLWLQNHFLSCVSTLKLANFVLKVKPK